MSIRLSQILGIASYEFRMLWRERALVVLTLALLLMVLIPSLIASSGYLSENAGAFGMLAEAEQRVTQVIRMMLWGPVAASLALLAPIFMADMIPKDEQLGVRELLDVTPLSKGAYLIGKLLGGWLALFASVLLVMLAAGLLWTLRIGSLDWKAYLEMWFFGAGGLVIINGGLGIMLTAPLSTRRRAILVMIAVLVGAFFFGGLDIAADVLSPIRGPIILYYISENLEAARPVFLQSIAFGLGQLVLVMLAMWAWLSWHDDRR